VIYFHYALGIILFLLAPLGYISIFRVEAGDRMFLRNVGNQLGLYDFVPLKTTFLRDTAVKTSNLLLIYLFVACNFRLALVEVVAVDFFSSYVLMFWAPC
jgi:hypothetical protein